MLQHRCNALKTHAGVDRRCRQRMQFTGGIAVVLHKHQVPDLDVPIQIIILAAGWTTGHIRAVVVKKL